MLIIGTGRAGERHYASLLRLGYTENLFCHDVDLDRAYRFSHGKDVRVVDKISRALELASQFGCIVCSVPSAHIENIKDLDCARADMLVEKPVVTCKTDLDRLLELNRASSSVMSVVSQHSYSSGANELAGFIYKNRSHITRVSLESAREKKRHSHDGRTWKGDQRISGGGVLITTGIHYIDILTRALGTLVLSNIYSCEFEGQAESAISFEAYTVDGIQVLIKCSWGEAYSDDSDCIRICTQDRAIAVLRNGVFNGMGKVDQHLLHDKQLAEFLNCRVTRQIPQSNVLTASISLNLIFDVYREIGYKE